MNLREMAQKIVNENPALSAIPVVHATALIRAAFGIVGDTVDGTADGMVNFQGLGVFRAKQVERVVEGKKVKAKVVMFRRPAPRPEAIGTAKAAKRR